MEMTRQQHYQRAQALLAKEAQYPSERERELAQVHATLAAAPAEVAGETRELVMELVEAATPSRIHDMTPQEVAGELVKADALRAKLEAALQELEAMDSMESTTWAASFIQGRVLGGEEGR